MAIIYDFFDISYGMREFTSKSHLIEKSEGVPLISSKGNNRGVYGYFNIKPKYKKVISVPRTGTICQAYYQENPCCIDDNCLVLKPKNNITTEEFIYFTLLIRNEKFRYAYGRQVTPDKLGNTFIPDKLPKWVYDNKDYNYNDIDKSVIDKSITLNKNNWKEFTLDELFKFEKGERLVKPKRAKGNTPLITATSDKNGVVDYISFDKFKEKKKHFKNKITIDMFFNVFYHDYEYFSDDNVHTLIPKFNDSKYLNLFLVTILKQLSYKYNYGRQLRLNRITSEIIRLPSDKNGKPDWEFMEDFIKSLPYSSNL